MSHPIPFNEAHRLHVLHNLTRAALPPDSVFARASRLAAHLFDAPMATVTLIDETDQYLKGAQDVGLTCTPRDTAFCSHTIMDDAPFVVPDAARDPRFADSPLVTEAPRIRFYAGAPLITDEGIRLGAVCVMDREPRGEPDPHVLDRLADIAGMVTSLVSVGGDGVEETPTADEARRTKEEFVGLISHELRTPLNAMIGFSDLMRQQAFGPLPAPYDTYADCIASSARNLLSIVDDVLTFSNLERSEIRLSETTAHPRALVDGACHVVGPTASQPEVTLIHDIDAAAPRLRVDAEQARQMLAHVIGNALRFAGPAPTIRIGFAVEANGDAIFTVADDGPGMPATDQSDAMTPFRQVGNGSARSHDGMGLGLPLTRRLVELHGGRLRLDSEPGAGTRVTITLPHWRVARAASG